LQRCWVCAGAELNYSQSDHSMSCRRSPEGGQQQDLNEEDDQVWEAGLRGALCQRTATAKESQSYRVAHHPIDAQTQEAAAQTDLVFHAGEPTDQAMALQVLHGCNTAVMPNCP
jgi:hypothetical protein